MSEAITLPCVTRYIGAAKIRIGYAHETLDGRSQYAGYVEVDGERWCFDDVCSPVIWNVACDSPEAYDRMAECAAAFAAYYTTHNRGDDVPEWAPSPELADAIDSALAEASDPCEGYRVKRSRKGPYRKVRDCDCTDGR